MRHLSISLILLLSFAAASGAAHTPRVLNGIDVLRGQNFAPLAGKRVGLITNHTGTAADGTSAVDLLFNSGVCKLVALFSPEHGLHGAQDEKVGSSVDAKTGLPIHSLYGEHVRPTPEMLRGLDAMVYDIQDIGVRFYTYSTTLGYAMEAAARAKVSFYVLDRPNPLGGVKVEGPMLDADKTSFVGYMPLPIRHGMTSGELARYFNLHNRIGADLHVVEAAGWRRDYYFFDTGQIWVNPSPNMRSLLQAVFYPGVCLLERTNVSVGRGTDKPFEIIGAPWIEPGQLAAELNERAPANVRFVPIYFTPDASTHRNARCGGVQLILCSFEDFHSVEAGLLLVSTLYRLYPDHFQIDPVLQLLGNEKVLKDLKAGRTPAQALQAVKSEVEGFLARRRKALIYGQSTEGADESGGTKKKKRRN